MVQKAPHADCDSCPLVHEGFAAGTGPDKAEVVIVGEAPGAQEVRNGTPFTGPSGQLLNRILASHGIDREDVYVTNTVLCRPPGNATPPTTAVRACRRRLVEELKCHEPKKVLALGNTAAQTLLSTKTGITTLRIEPPVKSKEVGALIVPTFHPAAALRNGDYLPSIDRDIKKLTRIQVGFEHTKFGIIDNMDSAVSQLQLQRSLAADTLTLDIEVDVDDMRRLDPKRPQMLCLAISEQPGRAMVYTDNICNDPYFQKHLDYEFTTDKKWVYQNGKFDIQFLWGLGVPNARVDEDTMLMHYATDERRGTHDLETLALEVLNAPRYKTDTRAFLPFKGASYRYIPPNVLYEYNASDADITHRLVKPLREEMESDGVEQVYRTLLIPGSNALARTEYIGIKVDRGRLGDVGRSLEAGIEEAESALRRWVGNPRSPQQVRAALDGLGADVDNTTKETLRYLALKGNAEVKKFSTLLLEHRRQSKLYSTYVRGLQRSLVRSRIHPSFLLHGTETGRLSCRRPNLQNVPSDSVIRSLFISGPDNVLLQADYSQVEFRLAGILSGDEWLINQFVEGRNFHEEVALELFGANYTDLEKLRAKAVNFGMLYGRGAGSLAAEHGGSFNYWQQRINDWFARMPKVKEYQKDLERQIKERGYLESYFGRKRRFWLVTRENWHQIQKEGYNFPLQSTASDLTLNSLIRLEPILRGKAAPVVTVHDSIMFEVKREYLDEVAHTVKEVMEDTPVKHICPTTVDVTVGTEWGKHMEDYVYA